MSAHTPGPWRFLGDHLLADHGRRNVVLGSGRNGGLVARDEETGLLRPLKLDSPDARLIAAAPDMLAALEHIDAVLNGACTRFPNDERSCLSTGINPFADGCCTPCLVRAAIEKARAK